MESMAEFTKAPDVLFHNGQANGFSVDPSYRSLYTPTFPETLAETYQRAGEVVTQLVGQYEGNLLFVAHEYTAIAGASFRFIPSK